VRDHRQQLEWERSVEQPTRSGNHGRLVECALKTTSNSQLGGTILVNAQGLTLYRLSGEQNGKFICTSTTRLQNWHPLVLPAGKPSGTVGPLGEVKRPDAREQVTYNGMPLYTFAADHSPGQANGQGIKDVSTWNAVMTTASQTSAPATTTNSSSSAGRSGY
jgi:predicted lipoprotein with Yx(FWY)xxD motif